MIDASPKPVPLSTPRWLPWCIVAAAVALFAAWAALGIARDPGFAFLLPRDGAQWIRLPGETRLHAAHRAPVGVMFGREFRLAAPLEASTLYVTGFRSVTVSLDGQPLLQEETGRETWKIEREIAIPGPLAAGEHVLLVGCVNDMGPPAIRVCWPEVGLRSGRGWFCTDPSGARVDAVSADAIETPALAREFPTVREAARHAWPWMLGAALIGGVLCLVRERGRPRLSPALVRWLGMALLLVLGLHNLVSLGIDIGTDVIPHYEYIHDIAARQCLPRADEGLQSFQAPLFYIAAAAMHEVLGVVASEKAADRFLRLVPILCGLGLVDLTYRVARRALPASESAQCVAIAMAALLPVMIVKTQVVSNEPLAGYLVALSAFAVLELAMRPPASTSLGRFALAGGLWGLATLAKVSALVLAAPFVLVLVWWMWAWPGEWRLKLPRVAICLAVFAVTCGWFFIRNLALYGQPVVGGWDAVIGFEWWQLPGYRTISQYSSFGAVFDRPLYVQVHGLWDGLYSTLWFDGEFSGVPRAKIGPTWNFSFAMAALPLALAPTLAFAVGALRGLSPRRWMNAEESSAARLCLFFSLLVVGAYFASIVGHSLALPYYNAIKASYALAAAPFFTVLIAYGVEPLLRRRWGRAAVCAWMAAWGVAIVAGYWAAGAE